MSFKIYALKFYRADPRDPLAPGWLPNDFRITPKQLNECSELSSRREHLSYRSIYVNHGLAVANPCFSSRFRFVMTPRGGNFHVESPGEPMCPVGQLAMLFQLSCED